MTDPRFREIEVLQTRKIRSNKKQIKIGGNENIHLAPGTVLWLATRTSSKSGKILDSLEVGESALFNFRDGRPSEFLAVKLTDMRVMRGQDMESKPTPLPVS